MAVRRGLWRSRGRDLLALARRAAKSFVRHNMVVYAMALAYRGLFALLPFALLLASVLSFLRLNAFLIWLAGLGPPGLRGPLPNLIGWLEDGVLGRTEGGLLSIGIVLAFWSVSMGARILTKALNAVFEVEETRPAWKRTAASVTVAPALALAMTAAVGLMLVTSRAMAWVSSWVGLDAIFVFLWGLLRVPVALFLLALVVSAVYILAPDRRLRPRSVVPGALLAVALWALASLAFAFGLLLFPEYARSTGSSGWPSHCNSTSTSRRRRCFWGPRSTRRCYASHLGRRVPGPDADEPSHEDHTKRVAAHLSPTWRRYLKHPELHSGVSTRLGRASPQVRAARRRRHGRVSAR